jgi:trimeric autotransporter adhesin
MKKILLLAFAGFALTSAIAPGSLRAGVPGDEHWDSQFGSPGVNYIAYGIAVISNKVYVTGLFTAAGNTRANYVAGFDGTNWFPLNGGLMSDGAAGLCAVADNNYLYVGGIFTNADDPTANNTARWDGTSWSGIGLLGAAKTVKRHGNNLYFGGAITGAAGVNSTNIVGWNGTNWFALGPGLDGSGFYLMGYVNCLEFQGNNVYAGGTFSYSGTSSMTNIAYWDGSAWHAMGNPFNGFVNALQFYGGYLYAGGTFTNRTLLFTNIARWNGSAWSAVPGGSANRAVYDFATDGTNLYVGGLFTQIGGIPGTNIVAFDGATWKQVGGGLHYFQNALGEADKLLWHSNQLYVAGGFDRAGNSVGAANVARWDGTNWWSLGGNTSKGMSPSLNFVQTLRNIPGSGSVAGGLYAGGLFVTAGKTNANCIARYDGTNWNALAGGMSGGFTSAARVYAIVADSAEVFAGGNFTNAGLFTGVGGLAYWDPDTANWWPLRDGMDYIVNALVVDRFDRLWIGGQFTNAVSVTYAKGLAVWDWNTNGATYVNYGNVDGTNATVGALAYDGTNRIYAGGQFYSIGGVAATNVAYYDYSDGSWHALGPGIARGKVNALAYSGGQLYAGGTFTNAGGITANRIAKWGGSSWSALGTGIIGTSTAAAVNGIAVSGTNVYVTGNFTNAGGILASNVAVWNGTNWSAMGSGTASSTSAVGDCIAAAGNDVYVGGRFGFAGDKPAQFFAHWNSQSNYYPATNLKLTRSAWQTNRMFRFRVTGTSGQSYIIQGSTNLSAWKPLQTNSVMFYDFVDATSTNYPFRCYRVVLGP